MARRTQRTRLDERRVRAEAERAVGEQERGRYVPPDRAACRERAWFQSIDAFRAEISRSLAIGALADVELEVVGTDGRNPVVVALAEERLPVLLRRVEAVGGYANVLVRTSAGVVRVAVMDASGALDLRSADDMRAAEEQPSPASTVGAFVDHLVHQRGGVVLPARLATASQTGLPARQVEVVAAV